MATRRLKANKIQDAIQKAQRVGEAEEKFTIDGCEVVLRSLQPGEYQAVLDEIEDLEDAAYMNGYRFGHLSRSLIEINGESLREFDFIEVEDEVEVDGVKQLKPIALERHKFIADYILASWSIPAIEAAFRKFGDVVDLADAKAVQGIEFRLPEETPEDKFRRLLTEAKDLEGQIPFELVSRILNEVGYMSKSSKEELESVDARLASVAAETDSSGSPVTPQELSSPVSTTTPSQVRSAPRVARVPLNQTPVSVPTQVVRTEPEEARRPAIPLSPEVIRRARELEALEGNLPTTGVTTQSYQGETEHLSGSSTGPAIQSSTRVAESVPGTAAVSSVATPRVDPNSLGSILDRGPSGGVNPRYRPPPRV
jgi:hypothetical protein